MLGGRAVALRVGPGTREACATAANVTVALGVRVAVRVAVGKSAATEGAGTIVDGGAAGAQLVNVPATTIRDTIARVMVHS
jgi:hypothetical protein